MRLLPATIEVLKDRMSTANDNRRDAEANLDEEVAAEWAQVYDAISFVLANPSTGLLSALPHAMDELSNWVDIAFAGRADWTRDDARQVRSVVIDLARAEFYGKTDPNALVTGRRVSTIVVDGVRRDFGYPLRINC